MKLRKSNVLALIDSGVALVQDELDADGNVVGQRIVTNPQTLGDERELTNDVLIELAETMAGIADVVFQFKFSIEEEYAWHGGIFEYQDRLELPTNEEESKKLDGTPLEHFTGRWLRQTPDIAVFDRDIGNLFCQLVTALAEKFEVSFFEEPKVT